MQKKLIRTDSEYVRFRLLELEDAVFPAIQEKDKLDLSGPISRFRNLELDDVVWADNDKPEEIKQDSLGRFRYLEMDEEAHIQKTETGAARNGEQAYKEFKQRLSEFRLLEMPDGTLPAIYKQAKALKLIEKLGPAYAGAFADGRNYLACLVSTNKGFLNGKTFSEQVQLLTEYGLSTTEDISEEIGLLNIAAAKNFINNLQKKAPELIYRNYRIMTGELKDIYSEPQEKEEILNIHSIGRPRQGLKNKNKPQVVHLGNNNFGPLDNYNDQNENTLMVIAAYIP